MFHTQYTTPHFTSQEKCRLADNLTLAVVNRRHKITDNIRNIAVVVK